jgi:RNA polymerase sigma-70 factor (ECF subfamily)
VGQPNPETLARVSKDEAFEAFLNERYGKVVSAVRLIARESAEDIAQEAFARAYIHWNKLWPDGNPVGWVHRVATNLALSLRTRAAREVRAVARLGKRTAFESPAPEAYPELHEAVASLPARQRAAVALYYVLDLSIEECAKALKCKDGTVKRLLFDAREGLRTKLGEDYR